MERLCSVCGWEILFRSRNINNIVCVLHTAGRKECFPALPVVFLVTKILINMSFHNRIVERKRINKEDEKMDIITFLFTLFTFFINRDVLSPHSFISSKRMSK